MRIKGKKHIILPAALFIYTVILAIMSIERYQESGKWGEFSLIICISLLLAFLLFLILKRKEEIRNKFLKKD